MIGNVCNDPFNTENIIKGKVTPVLNYALCHDNMWGSAGTARQLLTKTLDECELSASHPCSLVSGNIVPYPLRILSFNHLCSCCSHLEHRAPVKRFVSLQFLNLRQTAGLLDGDQPVARSLPTQDNTNTE
jgi:hypothetical protein